MSMSFLVSTKTFSQTFTESQIPYQKVSSGSLFLVNEHGYQAAITQNSDYQVKITGLIARVNFTQTFSNSTDQYIEAIYVFPLINDAAVDSMVMEIGERRIVGSIKEKQHAKQLYIKAKVQGKKASLVSQQRPNLFTSKIANIAPGETIKISLSYLQSIHLNKNIFSLRIPLTLTPRYIPLPSNTSKQEEDKTTVTIREINQQGWAINNPRVTDASEITPFQQRLNTTNHNSQQKLTLSVKINTAIPIKNLVSQYHSVNKTEHIDSVEVEVDDNYLLDQDFILQWQLSQGNVPQAAFFSHQQSHKNGQNYGYGLLMLMPPESGSTTVMPKDVIYIIDTSGSMGGVAIRQAKKALISALGLLNPSDSFNIIAFDDGIDNLFQLSKLANSNNLERANKWINQLVASGGTNMYPAIEFALKKQHPIEKTKYKQVVFITDGSVGNEDELLNLIDKKLENTRLHTVGIGSAPNGYFMEQAAKVGRGTYRYIGNINEVKEEMLSLFNQINKPLLRNIQVDWPVNEIEHYPKQIPDLYEGQPLLISMRWQEQEAIQRKPFIEVSGTLADKYWKEQIAVKLMPDNKNVAKSVKAGNGVGQWWARKKIADLNGMYRRANQSKRIALKAQITSVALAHSMVSPFTSFIAIEQQVSRKTNEPMVKKAIKNLMPKGSSQQIPIANTATGIESHLYFGILFSIISLFIFIFSYLFEQKNANKSQ